MAAAKKSATKSVMPILEAQIRTAAFLAQENLSNIKFLKLIDLQLANGASVFLDKRGIYTNHQAHYAEVYSKCTERYYCCSYQEQFISGTNGKWKFRHCL